MYVYKVGLQLVYELCIIMHFALSRWFMLYAYKKAPRLIYVYIELSKKLMTDLELNSQYTHSYIIKQPPPPSNTTKKNHIHVHVHRKTDYKNNKDCDNR